MRKNSGGIPKHPLQCLVLVLCLLCCLGANPSFQAAAETPPKPSNLIRVGSFPYAGQLTMDSDGNYSGYGFDYLQEIARYTGWEYEFVDATWNESLTMLEQGEIDLVGAVMKSPQREEIFDFSHRPMISGYGVLATNRDNATLPYEDFVIFDGLRVGVLESNEQGEHFLQYSAENGFTPRMAYYKTQDELETALWDKEIDAIIMTSVLRSSALRVVAKFGENDSYFATTKGNAEVLDALNEAMTQIRFNNPYYNSELDRKYFNVEEVTPISFTREEEDFLRSSDVIRCVYDPSARPICYYNEQMGAFRGIAADIFTLLEEKTGLTLEVIHARTVDEASERFRNGEAELFLSGMYGPNWAQEYDATLTNAYLEGQTVMVTKSGEALPDAPVVAVSGDYVNKSLLTGLFGDSAVVRNYATVEECLDAVSSGAADATYANSFIISYQGMNPQYSRLTFTPMYGYSDNSSIAVAAQTDPVLLSVLNKALDNISTTQINHIVSANLKPDRSHAIINVLYAQPLQVIALISAVLLLIAAILIAMVHSRTKNAKAMKTMLYTDALTGYPNYKALTEEAPALVGRQPGSYALIYMDMHQFKTVNDLFGYDAGDRLLIGISTLLHDFVKADERFARVYADKFVLLLCHESDQAFAERMKDFSSRLESLSTGEFETMTFLFSGGIYHLNQNACSLDMAFDRANYAKNTIKEQFVNTFILYDDVMRNQIMREKSLESRMLPALERGEFVPFYQPKVNVITGEVVGAEALVRWNDPERGCIAPDEFLPFYEKNGLIVQIDFAIYEKVCQCLRQWRDDGETVVPISVNYSRRNMQDEQFVEKLKSIADRYGISPSLLEIEITETVALENTASALSVTRALREHGFALALDDYGSGYSTISLLQDLPLDVLKLDKTFIESAMRTQKAQDLMSHVVAAVKANGVCVVCEGIETTEQRDFIVSLNCRFAQGYLYARPMPQQEFLIYLRSHAVSRLDAMNYISITNFSDILWSDAENFLGQLMPGWIVCCYATKGHPIFYISPRLLDYLGYSELEFQHATGGLFSHIVTPDDLQRLLAGTERDAVAGHEYQEQFRIRKKDGSSAWLQLVGKKLSTDDSKEVVLCVCTDITEMVLAQQEREALINTIPGGVCEMLITPEGPVIQHAAAGFYTLIGHTEEEMEALENRFFAVIHARSLSTAKAEMERACSSEKNACQCTFCIQHSDGSPHWLSMHGALRRCGEKRCVTAVIYNIDEEIRKKQETDIIRKKLELALNMTDQAVFEYDLATRCISEHKGFENYFSAGFPTQDLPERAIEGGSVYPQDVDRFRDMFHEIFQGADSASCEVRLHGMQTSGTRVYRWVKATLNTICDEDGNPVRVLGVLEDINRQKQMERAFIQEKRYRRAVVASTILSYDVNLTRNTMENIAGSSKARLKQILDSLPEATDYTGVIDHAINTMIAAVDRERFVQDMNRENLLRLFRKGVIEREYEYRRLLPDGRELWVSALTCFIRDENSGDILCYLNYRNIQARKEDEQKLEERAMRDPLTQLLNRASAELQICNFLAQGVKEDTIQAFMMIDVDNFKKINDLYGHQVGDRLLLGIAQVLSRIVGANDIVARFGGDEFVVLAKNLRDRAAAEQIADEIVQSVRVLGEGVHQGVEASVSIGVAIVSQSGAEFDAVYHCADKAMYMAKRSAKCRAIYTLL